MFGNLSMHRCFSDKNATLCQLLMAPKDPNCAHFWLELLVKASWWSYSSRYLVFPLFLKIVLLIQKGNSSSRPWSGKKYSVLYFTFFSDMEKTSKNVSLPLLLFEFTDNDCLAGVGTLGSIIKPPLPDSVSESILLLHSWISSNEQLTIR